MWWTRHLLSWTENLTRCCMPCCRPFLPMASHYIGVGRRERECMLRHVAVPPRRLWNPAEKLNASCSSICLHSFRNRGWELTAHTNMWDFGTQLEATFTEMLWSSNAMTAWCPIACKIHANGRLELPLKRSLAQYLVISLNVTDMRLARRQALTPRHSAVNADGMNDIDIRRAVVMPAIDCFVTRERLQYLDRPVYVCFPVLRNLSCVETLRNAKEMTRRHTPWVAILPNSKAATRSAKEALALGDVWGAQKQVPSSPATETHADHQPPAGTDQQRTKDHQPRAPSLAEQENDG